MQFAHRDVCVFFWENKKKKARRKGGIEGRWVEMDTCRYVVLKSLHFSAHVKCQNIISCLSEYIYFPLCGTVSLDFPFLGAIAK